MAYNVSTLNVAWARKHFPVTMSWQAIIDTVEAEAVNILVAEDGHDSRDWAAGYFPLIRNLAHSGDCSECRSWMRAPITCDACVYDEYMAKAWESLKSKVETKT